MAGLGSANARYLGVLRCLVALQCSANVGVDGLGGETSAKCVSVAVFIVSCIDEGFLCVDSDAVLLFLGWLVVQCVANRRFATLSSEPTKIWIVNSDVNLTQGFNACSRSFALKCFTNLPYVRDGSFTSALVALDPVSQ